MYGGKNNHDFYMGGGRQPPKKVSDGCNFIYHLDTNKNFGKFTGILEIGD